MTRSVEKNDVDISQLFKWRKEVVIADALTGHQAKVYIRLAGDADIGRARAYGYRKAAEMRKSLKDSDSDERVALLAEMEEFSDKESLVQTILLLRVTDLYNEAVRHLTIKEPTEPPSDASQEAWEKYQEEVDNFPALYETSIRAEVDKEREKQTALLEKETKETLYKIYEAEVINRVCSEAMQLAYYDMCIYLTTFKDSEYKNLAFRSFDDYENTHSTLKERLKNEYQSLEIGVDELKKLPEATE